MAGPEWVLNRAKLLPWWIPMTTQERLIMGGLREAEEGNKKKISKLKFSTSLIKFPLQTHWLWCTRGFLLCFASSSSSFPIPLHCLALNASLRRPSAEIQSHGPAISASNNNCCPPPPAPDDLLACLADDRVVMDGSGKDMPL